MAITGVRIHPAIGVARLGNSPTDFFIGPETTAIPPIPPGGYKDSQCRVKRQAARFRLVAYYEAGASTELTSATASVTWRVSLANRKAAALGFPSGGQRNSNALDRSKLVIAPPSGTLAGPNQVAKFNTGSITTWRANGTSQSTVVDLGEARTDPEGRLLVLGGFGRSGSPTNRPLNYLFNNEEWFDDIADGPVSATVTILETGQTFEATGAWVITAPPKYAPPLVNAITLWDRLFDFFVSSGLMSAPSTTSFARDVAPILISALDVQDVNASASGAHNSAINRSLFPIVDPMTRQRIFNRLRNPAGGGGNMPSLMGSATLTSVQYEHMRRWKDGVNIDLTWPVSPPVVSPQELDRAALYHCVGAAFFPGIEAGDFLIESASIYSEPFRLNLAIVKPGEVSARMSLPWQTDFSACGHLWWPANRPNQVRTAIGGPVTQAWDRNHAGQGAMVTDWPILGFVVEQGGERIETERCDAPFISPQTPHLAFLDIPQGPGGASTTTARAINFEISSGEPVTLEFVSGGTAGGLARLAPGPFSFGPTGTATSITVRLWITYTTGSVGSSVHNEVVVRHQQSGKAWTIPVDANTVARKTIGVALALDRSGSMSEVTGSGVTKLNALKDAVSVFTDLAFAGDGVGAAHFNESADVLVPVATFQSNSPFDAPRANLKAAVDSLTASGTTSVGAGLEQARDVLNAAPAYDRHALVVLTDGKENRAPLIADVADTITASTYAIGLGNANNVNANVLQTLSGNRGGYLLLTGPILGDNRFVLTKYFMQILAGISNQAIVTDPQGYLGLGETHRIPFFISECENLIDVILLTPFPKAFQYELITPVGERITPSVAMNTEFIDSKGVSFYRIRLPLLYMPERTTQEGIWEAEITLRERVQGRPEEFPEGRVPYSLSVHAVTDLQLRASLFQEEYRPGAKIIVNAELSHYGIPWQDDVRVWAEVTPPFAAVTSVELERVSEGGYSVAWPTQKPGVYTFRVLAQGATRRGWKFTREQTVTGAIFIPGQDEEDPREERRLQRFESLAKWEATNCDKRDAINGELH